MSLLISRTRRSFVKRFAVGVAALSVSGRGWRNPLLLDLEAAPAAEQGTVRLTLTEFPVLQQDLGSVRLTPNPVGQDHFPQGNLYPLLVNRAPGGTFYAMSAECSHAHCVVDSYDELEQGLRCPCHRSLYGLDGAVLIGPAKRALKSYPVSFDGRETLTIRVPGLAFRVSSSLAGGPGASRFRLSFPTEPNVTYQVLLRESVTSSGTAVPFSIGTEGALDQTSWVGDGELVSLYVAASLESGFFEIAMVLLEA